MKHIPRPHQQEAIQDVIAGFESSDGGQLIMACGSGKTLTELWIAEALKTKLTIVFLPSISLLEQFARLAEEAGMSVPALHAIFRTVTQTSPIQYIKSTRLHQARLMNIRDGVTVAAAAGRVAYESTSQFSREFKRLFGRTPIEEARDMCESFTLSPSVRFGA